MASGWMLTVWRGWIQGAKAIRRDAVKDGEATVQQGDITKESEEVQIRR